jgi:hypothetical protein
VPAKNTVVVIVILVIGMAIGTAAVLSLTISQHPGGSAHYTPPPDDCIEDNSCAATQFNGSMYELRGAAYEAYRQNCEGGNRCYLVAVNGTGYMLAGEAYQAYLDIDNIAIPLYTIKFESRYLPSQVPYLVSIYGPTAEVQSLAMKYNVSKSYAKIDYDDVTAFYGWISRDNLIRFMDENNVDSLGAKSVSVSPVGSYTVGNETVNRIPFPLPDEEKLAKELEAFRQDAISEIIAEKTGVFKLSSSDFFSVG